MENPDEQINTNVEETLQSDESGSMSDNEDSKEKSTDNNDVSKPKESNKLAIDIPEEEEDRHEPVPQFGNSQPEEFQFSINSFPGNDGGAVTESFEFSFNDFPQEQVDSQAAFTFDANEEKQGNPEADQLFEKFVTLISNPCFDYKGRPLDELFLQDDPTESAEAAYEILVGEATK